MVSEAGNVRKGFVEDEAYADVLKELPDHLKTLFAVGYHIGVRLGELKRIRWNQVDFGTGFIMLNTGEMKNGDGRTVPILKG